MRSGGAEVAVRCASFLHWRAAGEGRQREGADSDSAHADSDARTKSGSLVCRAAVWGPTYGTRSTSQPTAPQTHGRNGHATVVSQKSSRKVLPMGVLLKPTGLATFRNG